MSTERALTLVRGADFTADFVVTDSGNTFSVEFGDRFRRMNDVAHTVSVVDATTVRLSISAEEIDTLVLPAQIRLEEWVGEWGYYTISEDDGSSVSRLFFGSVSLTRQAGE